jgi:hypothetical protein
MDAKLRLVSDNPNPVIHQRFDGYVLRYLADRLTEQIKAGFTGAAHAVAEIQHLSPMDTAVIASWMTKAGLSEAQILKVMVGDQAMGLSVKPGDSRSKQPLCA